VPFQVAEEREEFGRKMGDLGHASHYESERAGGSSNDNFVG
jgi:hypothetical protein